MSSQGNDRWAALREERPTSRGGSYSGGGGSSYSRSFGGGRGLPYSGSGRSGYSYGHGGDGRGPPRSRGYDRGEKSSSYGPRKMDSNDSLKGSLSRPTRWSKMKDDQVDTEKSGLVPAVMKRRNFLDDPDAGINPINGKPYSRRYTELLKSRRQLPIFAKRDEVLTTVEANRFVVLVGDTGSGKTTQVPHLLAEHRNNNDGKVCRTRQASRDG